MTKKIYFFLSLTIFVLQLCPQAFAASPMQSFIDKANRTKTLIKDAGLDFAKKHPYISTVAAAAAAGGLAYGGWQTLEYCVDRLNPLGGLAHWSKYNSTKKFNRSIGFLRTSDQIHSALQYRLSREQRRLLLTEHAQRFSLENAMEFLLHSGNQLQNDYEQLTALNPTVISTPEAALDWCRIKLATPINIRDYRSLVEILDYEPLINLFFQPDLKLSEATKQSIIHFLFNKAWENNDFNRMRLLFDMEHDRNRQISLISTLINQAISNNQTSNVKISLISTLINQAISNNQTSKVILLLNLNPELTKSTDWAPRLFHFAAASGNIALFEHLLHTYDVNPNHKTLDGDTALHEACIKRRGAIIGKLLGLTTIDVNAQDDRGETPLHKAFRSKDMHTVLLLLSHPNIDPTLKNREGKNALDCAIKSEDMEVIKICVEKFNMHPESSDKHSLLFSTIREPEIIKYLVAQNFITGAERDPKNNTLFHSAIKGEHVLLINELIKLGKINLNAQNNNGRTPIHLLVKRAAWGYIKTLLEQYDADLSLRDKYNRSALGLLRKKHEDFYNAIQTYTPENISCFPTNFSPVACIMAKILIETIKKQHCSGDPQKITTIINRLSQTSACSICLEEPNDPGTTLCCLGAKYCAECLQELMKQPHPKCPHCREILFREMIIKVPTYGEFIDGLFQQIPCAGLSIDESSQDEQGELETMHQLIAVVRMVINGQDLRRQSYPGQHTRSAQSSSYRQSRSSGHSSTLLSMILR